MQKQSELAEGWSSIILEDFINIAARIGWKGLKRAEYTDSGPLMLAVKDILIDGNIDYEGISEHLSDFRYDESPEIKLKENDILVTKDGTIGKIGFVDNLDCKVTVNSSILVVRPSPAIDPRYLFYYFRSPFFQKIVQMKITGSAVPHIFQKDIKKFQVLIPPLTEQHRIVSAIEALFARLDAASERLDRVPEILKKFRQSVLAAACDGRLTESWREENLEVEDAKELIKSIIDKKEMQLGKKRKNPKDVSNTNIYQSIPKSWSETSLDEISIKITDGTHHSPSNGPEGDFKYITAKNIKNDGINLKKITFISAELHGEIFSRCNPEYGDLLLIKDGATTGIVTLNNLDEPFSMLSSVALLKFPDNILNKYIMYCIRSPIFQINIFKKMGGAAITRLTLKKISNMVIPLPPLPEQHEIVRRVDALFALADSIESKVVAARKRTEKLRQSVLSKAFSGEIVETEAELARREGRDYEPADVLLERIKAEQGKSGKKRKAAKL